MSLSLSQRSAELRALLNGFLAIARRIILFGWHGPQAFVNSLRHGFMKTAKGKSRRRITKEHAV